MGRRRMLQALLYVLTSISIAATSMAVWTHEVALTTDRWVEIVGPVAADPAVQQAVSATVARKVVLALDVQDRLETILSVRLQPLAAPIAAQVEQGLQRRLATAMATPEFLAAWTEANRSVHRQVVEVLRGRSEVLFVDGGVLVIDVWPLVGIALAQLQADGVLDAATSLPDLSHGLPAGSLDDLDAALGGRIPASLGTVPIAPADGLLAAQRVASLFDAITAGLIVVSLLLALATIWFAKRRRTAVILVAVGSAAGLLLASFAIGGLESALLMSVADADTASTVGGVLHAAIADLFGFSGIVIAAGLVVALAAYLAGRPAWLRVAGDSVGTVVARQMAAALGNDRSIPPRDASAEAVAASLRRRRRDLERLGFAAIAFTVVWIGAGPSVAALAVALVVILEAGLEQLDGGRVEPSESPH